MGRVDEVTLVEVLCVLYLLCPSPNCRVPREAVMRKLRPEVRGLAGRALEELRRRGLAYKAGGKDAYGLTRSGVKLAQDACKE